MATDNVKDYLFEQTGIAQSNWKRISKKKNSDGSETRIFEDKSSGKILETIEFKNGVISIEESSNESLKKTSDTNETLKIIKKYYKSEGCSEVNNKYRDIPTYFKFCFLEDANVDQPTAIEEAAKALDPNVTVAGFNLFFMPTFKSTESIHLGPLLKPFLPSFLGETEECTFTIHPEVMHVYDDDRIEQIQNGTFPNVPYNLLIDTLESLGFVYYKQKCMLASLRTSQDTNSTKPKI
jgi:hypothetical protein